MAQTRRGIQKYSTAYFSEFMIKAIGFNLGQFGDLCMNVVPSKAFKLMHPDSHFTFNMSKRYSAIKEIFLFNQYIDDVKVWDGYNDNWETSDYTTFIRESKFDIIYNPMIGPQAGWQMHRHQTAEMCRVHSLTPPENLQIELNQYFDLFNDYKKYIAVCYSGATDSHKKNLSEEKTLEISRLIESLGYKPLFFQNKVQNYDCYSGQFFDAIKIMLSCKMLITIDSAMCWIASGYKFPTLGLYNKFYYSEYGATTSKNWQPINPNAIYLENNGLNSIIIEDIEKSMKELI